MSFLPPLKPLERQLTCCGFDIPKHTEDLRKELDKILKKINSNNDSTSKDALEERRKEINDELVRLTLLPGCPCNGECKRYLCSRNDDPFSFNEK